jgi:hypothetical protein
MTDSHLEELPDLPDDLPELPDDLPDLPDLPEAAAAVPAPKPPAPGPVAKAAPAPAPAPKPAPVKPAPAPAPKPVEPPVAAAAPASGPAAPLADGERPPLRVLDKAPTHLRLAALIVVGASLLPWMPGEVSEPVPNAWIMTLLAKGLVLAGAWIWLQQVLHNFGPARPGVIGQLGNLSLIPKKKVDDDAKGRRSSRQAQAAKHLEHPFPTGLHLISLLLAIGGLVLAAGDPRAGLIGSNGIAEVAMLGWAAFTWVHIASYERWGSFNPLFPLMFLGMLFAGAAGLLSALGVEGAGKLLGMLGGAGVAAGGGLAGYTIAEAMMQAKKEGDRKKAEALEARRAARQKK